VDVDKYVSDTRGGGMSIRNLRINSLLPAVEIPFIFFVVVFVVVFVFEGFSKLSSRQQPSISIPFTIDSMALGVNGNGNGNDNDNGNGNGNRDKEDVPSPLPSLWLFFFIFFDDRDLDRDLDGEDRLSFD
jgi:hypothetical protein